MKTLKDVIKPTCKIGYFCNFLNEIDGIKNHAKTMNHLDFDARIYVDGRYPGYPHKDISSTDGSLDIIKTMPNSHVISGGEISEMDKNNLAFKKAAELGIEFLIQIDADEWIDFDRNTMIESFIQEAEGIGTFQFMTRFTNHKSSPPRMVNMLPRLFWKPQFLESKEIHWWYYAFGIKITVDPNSFIEGCHIHHDDRIRSVEKNELMNKYQEKNIPREQGIIKKDIKNFTVRIEEHDCKFDFKYAAGRRCYICNGEKDA